MSAGPSRADPRFTTRARQPGLDLLRALAIALVVFYHAGIFGFALPNDWQRFGWIGVDLFFVLSGYLISGQLFASLARGESLPLRNFFWRRVLRILPAYLAVLAVYVFLPALREYPAMPPAWEFLGFVQNLGLRGGTAFSHAWSLCIEAQFYLALPFLLLAFARVKHAGFVLPLLVIAGGMLLRGVIASRAAVGGVVPYRIFQPWIYYATWSRLDPLTLGVSLAALERFRPAAWSWLLGSARWLWAPGLAMIVGGLSLGESKITIATCIFAFPLIATGMTALLVCALSPRFFAQRKPLPGVAFIASVAYSVYLSHKLAIHVLQTVFQNGGLALTSPVAIGLLISAIAVTGSVLFFAVERPFLQLRQRQTRTPRR